MRKILFALTPAQKLANGSAIYTNYIFQESIKKGKIFEAFYNPLNKLNPNFTTTILPRSNKLHKCVNTKEIENLLFANKYDVVFFGSETDTNCKMPNDITPIITIHDLRYMEVFGDKFRHYYRKSKFARFKQKLLEIFYPLNESQAQKKRISKFIYHPKLQIVTVSNHTKYSILHHFPHLTEKQIHVLYCPFPEIQKENSTFNLNSFQEKHNIIKEEYFLIISAGRWFKNSHRAIQAFDSLISRGALQNKKVVVLGIHGSQKITRVKNTNSFIFADYVDDETLQLLFANAFSFIYPSLQEGFGIPPLDAMQYGTPVLASAATSIAEICGDGAYYFNPYSIQEIENRIAYLLNDKIFYNSLCKAGLKRRDKIAKKQEADLDQLLALIFD